MKFKNPTNGYIEETEGAWLWALLFGFFYFAIKGVWTHAIIGLMLAIPTWGLTWLIYPFFASSIMRKHYLRHGWVEIQHLPDRSLAIEQPKTHPKMIDPKGPSSLRRNRVIDKFIAFIVGLCFTTVGGYLAMGTIRTFWPVKDIGAVIKMLGTTTGFSGLGFIIIGTLILWNVLASSNKNAHI